MDEARLEEYRLLGGLASHHRRVERALVVIDEALSASRNPYVAWSGGKDSTVLLDLVRQRRRDVPALTVQTDIEFPDHAEFVREAARVMGVNLTIIHPKISAWELLRSLGGAGWVERNKATSKLDRVCFFEPIACVVKERDYDLVFLGLRAEESRPRLMNRRKRGLLYVNRNRGLMTCAPLGDWSGKDVMAYLVSHGLPISPIYAKTMFHPEPERIREGWWVPGEHRAAQGEIAWLRRYYPDLYARLASEWPEVASHL